MSSQPVRNSERNRKFVPIVLLAASLLTLTISTRSLQGLPEEVGVTVFGFFQRGFAGVGDFISGTISSIAELRRLKKDYDSLSQKLEQYSNLERGYADLRNENDRLKEQLGFSEKLSYDRVSARIVAKDPENIYASLVINKGSEAGIRKNMPVVAFQNGQEGLVGRVVEVGRGSSIVVPLYDSSSYIAARLATNRYEGLITGRGVANEPLVMKYVNKRAKDEAQFGDLVVTSGYESIYPPDVAIGRIKKFKVLAYETSLQVDIDPVLDFSRLEYVFVIKPGIQIPAADGSQPLLDQGAVMPVPVQTTGAPAPAAAQPKPPVKVSAPDSTTAKPTVAVPATAPTPPAAQGDAASQGGAQ
jgi:rod shape-determining protein MreC